jgi:hypothetical protein
MARNRKRIAVLAAVAAAGALGASAATVVGDDGTAEVADRAAGSKEPLPRLAVRPADSITAARAGARVRAVAARRPRLRVSYYVIESSVNAGEFNGGILSCPRSRPRALGGGFDSPSPVVFLSTNRPDGGSGRDWAVGVTNLGDTGQPWIAVIVCARV